MFDFFFHRCIPEVVAGVLQAFQTSTENDNIHPKILKMCISFDKFSKFHLKIMKGYANIYHKQIYPGFVCKKQKKQK